MSLLLVSSFNRDSSILSHHKSRLLGAIGRINCCIYWAVRKARMEIIGERVGQREEGKDLEMKRNFLLEQFTFLHDSFLIDLVYFIFSDFFLRQFPPNFLKTGKNRKF